MKQKEFITSLIFFLLLIFLYGIFPVDNQFQNALTIIVFLVLLPVLYIKLILKKSLRLFGFEIGAYKQAVPYVLFTVVASLCVILLFANLTNFFENYELPITVTQSFWEYMLFEFTSVLLIIIVYDFFFRGFVYFTSEKYVGKWAILVQAVLFYVLVWFMGVSKWNFLPYIVFAPFAGMIVGKSRSIIYSIAGQLILFLLVDAYFIHLVK